MYFSREMISHMHVIIGCKHMINTLMIYGMRAVLRQPSVLNSMPYEVQ